MMTDPSSITSVTEEDSDESDTTESYSKTNDSVSSVLYSSECNTDDKLSTSLTNVSISKSNIASSSKKRRRKHIDLINNNEQNDSATTTDPPYPYGCHPLPLPLVKNKQRFSQAKKKQKNFHSTALTKYVLQKRLIHKAQSSSLPKQEEENFGVDDPNNHLYTDFSDTSSIPWYSNNDDDLDSIDDDDGDNDDNNSQQDADRPFLPDMRSGSWFQARCFDRYWSSYNFVMEWYRQHVEAVHMLSAQYAGIWPQPKAKKRNKAKRAKSRARNRRLAKAKHKANQAETNGSGGAAHHSGSNSNIAENELEMEITEDMMDFFTTSFKHRMERDQGSKEGSVDLKTNDMESKKDSAGDCIVSSLSGPREQPGVRRTAEMKILYGLGAPMIHGMETALQMTYDKVLDRHKPKLWPNMPLKIVFSKS